MLFNSAAFFIFLPVVFILYWHFFSKSEKLQNTLLLIASLFFYAWADWRFLLLILFSSGFNFAAAIKITGAAKEQHKQQLLWASVIVNAGILCYFKYFNFFYESIAQLFSFGGPDTTFSPFQIILPVGISFFTFQVIGYVIDVYNEKIEPCKDLVTFSTYVAFFPKLLAGPIERAQHFIPQIEKKRIFNYEMTTDGCRQILWGAFAKLAIADNCSVFVDSAFNNHNSESGGALLLIAVLYFIQVYTDFSGYSNMALGISKLFGLQLSKNFATPFFSVNIGDFWRRWHISLSSWMMDYVFTPVNFMLRRKPKVSLLVAVTVTFFTVGLWHGANWTFIVFGIAQSIYFLPLVLSGSINQINNNENKLLNVSKMTGMFVLMSLTFLLLRAESLGQATEIYRKIFSVAHPYLPDVGVLKKMFYLFPLIFFLMIMEWKTRNVSHPLQFMLSKQPVLIRWGFYCFIILLLCVFSATDETAFIYFQF